MVIGGVDVIYKGVVGIKAPEEIRCMLADRWSATGCVMSIEKAPYAWLFDPKPEFWKIPTELFVYESPKALADEDLSRQIHVMISPTMITLVVPEGNAALRDLATDILTVLKLKGYIEKE